MAYSIFKLNESFKINIGVGTYSKLKLNIILVMCACMSHEGICLFDCTDR